MSDRVETTQTAHDALTASRILRELSERGFVIVPQHQADLIPRPSRQHRTLCYIANREALASVRVLNDIICRRASVRASTPARRVHDRLTFRQITNLLNVSLMSVRNWCAGTTKRRPLPTSSMEVGRVQRIHVQRADLQRWLADYRPDLLKRL